MCMYGNRSGIHFGHTFSISKVITSIINNRDNKSLQYSNTLYNIKATTMSSTLGILKLPNILNDYFDIFECTQFV